jgi:cold shock CspA family protein/ribosome-associated translation inhibitor RaiA
VGSAPDSERENGMEIHWYNADDFDARQRRAAEERIAKLAEGHDDLIDLRITGRSSGHHRFGDREVRITCDARGTEIVASRIRDELGKALHDALDAFEREVRDLRERRRELRDERVPEPPQLGVGDRVFREEGYGFLISDAGEQVYFHRHAVKHGLEFERLEDGSRVAFNIEAGDKGPQANAVYPPPPDASKP